MTPQTYRRVMSLWPTGVSVVCGMGPDERPRGMVIGSFCSVSLEPALIAFFVKTDSTSWKDIQAGSGHFIVNVLSQEQASLCTTFSSGDPSKRFDHVAHDLTENGLPRIQQCCAWIEAHIENLHQMGDHLMVLGRVDYMQTGPSALPLVFARGRLNKAEALIQLQEDHFQQWETTLNSALTPWDI